MGEKVKTAKERCVRPMQPGRIFRAATVGSAISCLFWAVAPATKLKNPDWKVGTLLRVSNTDVRGGGGSTAVATARSGDTSAAGAAADAATGASIAAAAAASLPRTRQVFVIQGGAVTYKVARWMARKNPNVTVNGTIHYAIDRGTFYLLDEDGKYFPMVILEKALPAPSSPESPAENSDHR
jgi:hypothetical protein